MAPCGLRCFNNLDLSYQPRRRPCPSGGHAPPELRTRWNIPEQSEVRAVAPGTMSRMNINDGGSRTLSQFSC